MTLFKPTLILNQLVITRNSQVVYNQKFHKGLNVIYGKNSYGKTCIMDMIFYVLGGCLINEEWKEEIKLCTSVYAEVSINNEKYTLKRDITNPVNGLASMNIYEGNLISALSSGDIDWKKYGYRSSDNKNSFSNELFSLLGIPEVKTLETEHSITMNSCLRLMYFDQRTPYFEIFRNEVFDNEAKRKVIGDLMCGIYNADYYLLKNELRNVITEHKKLSDYLSSAFKVLGGDERTNKPEVFEEIRRKQNEELNDKLQEFNILRSDFYKDTMKKNNKKAIGDLIKNIENVSSDIEKLTAQLINLEYDSNDSQEFIQYLEFKLSKLEDSEKTLQYIDTIEISVCPVCFSEIKPSNDQHSCYLCKCEKNDNSKKFNLDKLKRNLLSQLQESNAIQIERLDIIASIKERLKLLHFQKSKYQKEFTMLNNAIASNEISFITINESIGYLKKDIEDTEKKLQLSKKIYSQIKQKEDLNEKITILTNQIEAIDLENSAKIDNAQNKIANRMKEILAEDVGQEDDLKNIGKIEVNFEKNRLFVDERSNYAASSMSYIKSCFALSFWMSSVLNKDFFLPRFSILDDIENKGLEPERIYQFQETIKNFCASSEVDNQIIISASNLSKDLQTPEFIIGHYYHDGINDKTLNFQSKEQLFDLIPKDEIVE